MLYDKLSNDYKNDYITPGDIFVHLTDEKGNIINVINMLELHAFFANNIFYFALPSAIIYSYLILSHYSEL